MHHDTRNLQRVDYTKVFYPQKINRSNWGLEIDIKPTILRPTTNHGCGALEAVSAVGDGAPIAGRHPNVLTLQAVSVTDAPLGTPRIASAVANSSDIPSAVTLDS